MSKHGARKANIDIQRRTPSYGRHKGRNKSSLLSLLSFQVLVRLLCCMECKRQVERVELGRVLFLAKPCGLSCPHTLNSVGFFGLPFRKRRLHDLLRAHTTKHTIRTQDWEWACLGCDKHIPRFALFSCCGCQDHQEDDAPMKEGLLSPRGTSNGGGEKRHCRSLTHLHTLAYISRIISLGCTQK